MTDAGYIALGYVAVFGSVGAYVGWVLRRGRTLSRQLPPEERRWT